MRVLAVLAVALLVASPAFAGQRHPTLSELSGEIMCPTCKGETIDQSQAPISYRIKEFISARIAAGDTKSEIKAKLVAQFGPEVLASPPKKGFNLLAWVLPLAGIGGGAAVLAVLAWRWSRSREPAPQPEPSPALDPELERRLDDELARFEA